MLVRTLRGKAEYKIVYANDSKLEVYDIFAYTYKKDSVENVLKGDSLWVGDYK